MSNKEVQLDELTQVTRQWSPTDKNIDEQFRENWRKWNPLQPPLRGSEVVRQFIDAWNASDIDRLASLTTPDAVHHTRYSDYRLEGVQLVRNLLSTILPNLQVTIEDLREEGNIVVAQVVARGTQTGGLLDIAPSNKEVAFAATDIFRVVDGVIAEHWWGVYNGLSALVDENGLNPVIGLIFAC